jgi:putative transposase
VQCRVLGVSISGFHQHLGRRRKIALRRHRSDAALLAHISALYAENHGAYGWPRIWRELIKRGIRVGKQRVQRLMQKHGIRARGKRRFRVMTTDSRHDLPIAPNLLNRNFTPAGPNQAWTGDLTYIATEEGWLFLAVVIDLFSRKVVGWSMRPDMHRSLVIDALERTNHHWLLREECGDRSRRWKCQCVESVENDRTVSHPSHAPWKSIKLISTFPPSRRLRRDELISQNEPT